jgi:hypothetical protein
MIVIHYVFRVVTSTFTFQNINRERRSSAELNTHCWCGSCQSDSIHFSNTLKISRNPRQRSGGQQGSRWNFGPAAYSIIFMESTDPWGTKIEKSKIFIYFETYSIPVSAYLLSRIDYYEPTLRAEIK